MYVNDCRLPLHMLQRPDVISRQTFFIATWLIALVDPSSYGLFTWHPLLMSLGIALFSYGMLLFLFLLTPFRVIRYL